VTQRLLIWLGAGNGFRTTLGWARLGCFENFFTRIIGAAVERKRVDELSDAREQRPQRNSENWGAKSHARTRPDPPAVATFFRAGNIHRARLPLPWKALEWGLLGGVAGMLVTTF